MVSDDVRRVAERLVNATNLADDSLTDFESDVVTVARYALAAAAREAALRAVLLGLASNPVHEPCWCPYDRNADEPHAAPCRRARVALAAPGEGESGE